MTTNVVTFDGATFEAGVLKAYNQKAMDELSAIAELEGKLKEAKLDFKQTVEAVNNTTKLPKKAVGEFFKARFVERQSDNEKSTAKGTKAVIRKGDLFSVLNTTLEA